MSPAPLVESLLTDLHAESADLDARVAQLPAADWFTPTPAAAWDIRDTVTHLHQTDQYALRALSDPEGFTHFVDGLKARGPSAVGHVDEAVAAARSADPLQLLEDWRGGRVRLVDAIREVPDGTRIPWFGPPMSAASFATARLMETWAHGQDVVDALGQVRVGTSRLRHIAEIGVRARPFAYAINGLDMPEAPPRIELQAPDGEVWTWGSPDAAGTITGPALDFCLLVTQRRHRDDLSLTVRGANAEQWMGIAQAYAGAAGSGRAPLGATR